MSIESAKAFIARMKTDEVFALKVKECPDAAARMALVKAAGLEFTAQELQTLKGELSDSDLEQISGGTAFGCDWVWFQID